MPLIPTRTASIEYTLQTADGETQVRASVAEASVLAATMRYLLIQRMNAMDFPPETAGALRGLASYVYPNIAAALTRLEVAGRVVLEAPDLLAFDDFLSLPESLWDRLTVEVKRLNPAWFGEAADDGSDLTNPKSPSPAVTPPISGFNNT